MELVIGILFIMILLLIYCLYLMYRNYEALVKRQNQLAEIVFNLLQDDIENSKIILTTEEGE